MKKVFNIAFVVLLLTVVFVPEVKASFQQGLMKLGFFKPDLKTEILDTNENSNEETAKPTHTMDFLDTHGKLITLKDLKGKVVFINFWATWCDRALQKCPPFRNYMINTKTILKLHSFYWKQKEIEKKPQNLWKIKN